MVSTRPARSGWPLSQGPATRYSDRVGARIGTLEWTLEFRQIGCALAKERSSPRLRGPPADAVRIGMGSGMAQMFMPRPFAQLRENLRGIRLEIVTAPTRAIFNDLHEER